MDSISLALAKKLLGKMVDVKIDRKLGSKHPKWGFEYMCNYGFIEGIMAPDGEELDAYLLLVDEPVDNFKGKVVAIVHRLDNDDDKLIVVPDNKVVSNSEIEKMVEFQEKFFKHEIVTG